MAKTDPTSPSYEPRDYDGWRDVMAFLAVYCDMVGYPKEAALPLVRETLRAFVEDHGKQYGSVFYAEEFVGPGVVRVKIKRWGLGTQKAYPRNPFQRGTTIEDTGVLDLLSQESAVILGTVLLRLAERLLGRDRLEGLLDRGREMVSSVPYPTEPPR